MTVAELIKELSELPPDMVVIVQKDPEGNEYSPLDGLGTGGFYEAETTWSGQVHYPEDFEGEDEGECDDCEDDEDEETECEKMPEGVVPCVTLCPVN